MDRRGSANKDSSETATRSFWSRARSLAMLVLSLGSAASLLQPPLPARAQDYRDASKAPPHWIQFAKLVKFRFEDWISADDEVANRFRTYLREHQGKDDAPPQMLEVRAWVNPDGTVEKISFPSLKNQQADDDLRAILKRGNIGEAPPPEMLQPLHLRFSLNLK